MSAQPGLEHLWRTEQVTPGQALQQAIMFLDELGHNARSLDLGTAGMVRRVCDLAYGTLPLEERRPIPFCRVLK